LGLLRIYFHQGLHNVSRLAVGLQIPQMERFRDVKYRANQLKRIEGVLP
jgi:hypothetical protein